MLNINSDSKEMVADLATKGILCYPMDPRRVRIVTHLDNSAAQIEQTAEILRKI
jgi:hypothetical protein